MVKRFAIGLAIGIAAMQWYINNGGSVGAQALNWLNRSSSKYSGQSTHDAARDLLNPHD